MKAALSIALATCLVLSSSCALMSGQGPFLDRLKADLASIDYVYHIADEWYAFAHENLPPSTQATIDHLRKDYEAARAVINGLIAGYSAAKQEQLDQALKALFDVLKNLLVIIANNKGPELDRALPLVAMQPGPASKYYRAQIMYRGD